MAVLVLDAVVVARPSPPLLRGRVGEGEKRILSMRLPPSRRFAPTSPARVEVMEFAAGARLRNFRHHSGAMRSGPSALTTRRVMRRQVKRVGGPSGTSASTLSGSGSASKRKGRGGLGATCSAHVEAPAKALLIFCARSGTWLCLGKSRRTALPLNRFTKRSIRGSVGPFSSVLAKAVCAGRSGSVESAASTIRSTPKPTSMLSPLSCKIRNRFVGSRAGALKAACSSPQDPSVR